MRGLCLGSEGASAKGGVSGGLGGGLGDGKKAEELGGKGL